MDNLTHSLFGLLLARTRLGACSPTATVALVVAANFPDADVFLRLHGGTAAYLEHHRGVTHGVLGILVQVILLTAVFRAIERRRGPASTSWLSTRGPLLPVSAGLISHPLLDLLNVYGIRPWLPFDATWYYGDLVFIVDPWLWLLLAAPAVLAGPRTRVGDALYALVGVVTIGLLYGPFEDRAPAFLRWSWLPAVALLAFARRRAWLATRPRPTLWVATALIALYLAGLVHQRASTRAIAAPLLSAALQDGESIVAMSALPEPARPRRWTWIVQTEERLLWQAVDAGDPGILRSVPAMLDDPAVRAASTTPAGRVWRGFARYPLARVLDDGSIVELTDGRYFYTDFCTLRVALPAGEDSR